MSKLSHNHLMAVYDQLIYILSKLDIIEEHQYCETYNIYAEVKMYHAFLRLRKAAGHG